MNTFRPILEREGVTIHADHIQIQSIASQGLRDVLQCLLTQDMEVAERVVFMVSAELPELSSGHA